MPTMYGEPWAAGPDDPAPSILGRCGHNPDCPCGAPLDVEGEDAPVPCGTCGSTETVEIHHEDEHSEQSITICAVCGSDE